MNATSIDYERGLICWILARERGYLANFLLEKGYRVTRQSPPAGGPSRPSSAVTSISGSRIQHDRRFEIIGQVDSLSVLKRR